MKHAIFAGCLAVMMLLSLSLFLLRPSAQREQAAPAPTAVQPPEQRPQPPEPVPTQKETTYDQGHTILVTDGAENQTLELRQYLIGVVLAEMPPSFELAALEAQAVASRTFALRQARNPKHEGADVCASGACCQQYADSRSVREKLGESYQMYYEKVEAAVDQTDGLVLLYGGALIDATYFSCSGGRTEAAVAVWGGDVPYLQPVDSPGEEGSNRFADSVTVEPAQLRSALEAAGIAADWGGEPAGWFGALTRTQGGGVDTLTLGGVAVKGTQLRSLLGLRSTNFTVSITDDGIVFETLGYGHRVGMSQYGAQAMAEAGSDFREILTHYYTGVTIEQAP